MWSAGEDEGIGAAPDHLVQLLGALFVAADDAQRRAAAQQVEPTPQVALTGARAEPLATIAPLLRRRSQTARLAGSLNLPDLDSRTSRRQSTFQRGQKASDMVKRMRCGEF